MKYYPIGTVVTLKDGDRPIMIYGRKQIQDNKNAEIGIYIDFSVNICYNWSIK